jgi:hypothetical protein
MLRARTGADVLYDVVLYVRRSSSLEYFSIRRSNSILTVPGQAHAQTDLVRTVRAPPTREPAGPLLRRCIYLRVLHF